MRTVSHFFRLVTALAFAAAAATVALVRLRARKTAAAGVRRPAARPLIWSAWSIRSSAWRSGSPAASR